MHTLRLSKVVTLALFIGLNLAAPITATSGGALSQLCANDPLIEAGTCLDRSSRPSGSLQTRKETETVLWRAPRSQTYVILKMGQRIVGNAVVTLLDKASIVAINHIQNVGDGVIANGAFSIMGDTGLLLNVWNSNNHQTTYGVLSAACTALVQYMTTTDAAGAVTFHIYDGDREVGKGQIG